MTQKMNIIELNDWLSKRKKANENDSYSIYECWDNIAKILSQNENDTILYLNHCKKEDLYYISEIFEEIAFNFKSQKIISTFEELNQKYPELDMQADIAIAKAIIK